MRFISELRCKGSEFFANRQTFRRKFSCKGQKSWFRHAPLPAASRPLRRGSPGGDGSGSGRLEPARCCGGEARRATDSLLRRSKAFTKAVAASRCGLEAGQNGPCRGAVRPVSGRNRGRFAARSSHCRQRSGLQAVGSGGRYVRPEQNFLTTPGAPLAWQASLLTTKKIVKHTAMPLPPQNFSLYLQLKSARREAADPPGRNVND